VDFRAGLDATRIIKAEYGNDEKDGVQRNEICPVVLTCHT
jgi:hypothetical protein